MQFRSIIIAFTRKAKLVFKLLVCFISPDRHDVSNAVGGDTVCARHVGDVICNGEGSTWQNDAYWATGARWAARWARYLATSL